MNRAICYCDDCQAFLHHLGRADLLDAHGGTDIIQVPPAALAFGRGTERIVGVRLTPKGLYRWYADCCKTPVGNTLTPGVPFVGIVAQAFEVGANRPDAIFGPPRGAFLGKFAIGTAPEGSTGLNPRLIVRAVANILRWRITGRTWPHPFFDRVTRAPTHPLTTLSPEARDALRKFCGPLPAASAAPSKASA